MYLKELPVIKSDAATIQMKMFVHNTLETVESEVNKWMAEHPRFQVQHIVQSQSEKQGKFLFVLSFFYRNLTVKHS
jgi:hypothetical protein